MCVLVMGHLHCGWRWSVNQGMDGEREVQQVTREMAGKRREQRDAGKCGRWQANEAVGK